MPEPTLPVGRTVREVRPLTPPEMEIWTWGGLEPPLALVLDDGTLLFPSRDVEGNGPGWFTCLGTLGRLADLVGQTITDVRAMTDREMRHNGWTEDSIDGRPCALVFGSGRYGVYPASDPEAFDAGSLFGRLPDGRNTTWHAAPG